MQLMGAIVAFPNSHKKKIEIIASDYGNSDIFYLAVNSNRLSVGDLGHLGQGNEFP